MGGCARPTWCASSTGSTCSSYKWIDHFLIASSISPDRNPSRARSSCSGESKSTISNFSNSWMVRIWVCSPWPTSMSTGLSSSARPPTRLWTTTTAPPRWKSWAIKSICSTWLNLTGSGMRCSSTRTPARPWRRGGSFSRNPTSSPSTVKGDIA